MPEAIKDRAKRAINERVFPGCVIGFIRSHSEPEYICEGAFTYEEFSSATSPSSLYDVASITKSIPTASLAHALAHEGVISLDDRVKDYIPELQNDHDARIRDLLTYRVSGARLSELKSLSSDAIYTHVFENGFSGSPGIRNYSNLPALILGLIIERISGMSLDAIARTRLFELIGMQSTAFYTGQDFFGAVPTEEDDWRGRVEGFTHDESAYVLGRSGRASGHAGLFSTAEDLMRFMRHMLQPRDFIWEAMTAGAEAGLGWQTDQSPWMGAHQEGAFGKTGFTGTSIMADRRRGNALVILSNRTYPKRPPSTDAINMFRRDIADIVFG